MRKGQLLHVLKTLKPPKAPSEAVNTLIGLFEVLHESGFSPARRDAWIERNGDRRLVREFGPRYDAAMARRFLKRLRVLAISALAACAWKDSFSIGALPIGREPAPPTAAQREASRRNAAIGRARRIGEKGLETHRAVRPESMGQNTCFSGNGEKQAIFLED